MIKGFDTSRHEDVTDWGAVKAAGYTWGSTRATVGNYLFDSRFKEYWKGMKQAGIHRIAYHVFDPGVSPEKQIAFFLQAMADDPGEGPFCLDNELSRCLNTGQEFSKEHITPHVEGCFNLMDAGALKVGLKESINYSNYNFMKYLCTPTKVIVRHKLWVANYTRYYNDLGPLPGKTPFLPPGYSEWLFWQYTEAGCIPGISGAVDLNVFEGTQDELAALFTQTALPPVLPTHEEEHDRLRRGHPDLFTEYT